MEDTKTLLQKLSKEANANLERALIDYPSTAKQIIKTLGEKTSWINLSIAEISDIRLHLMGDELTHDYMRIVTYCFEDE